MKLIITGLISLLTGGMLGVAYFGGLWITLKRFVEGAKRAHILMLLSFLVRTGVVISGFYALLLITHQWQAVAVALVGFVISRMIITRVITHKSNESLS